MAHLYACMTLWAKAHGYDSPAIEIEENANYAPLLIGRRLVVGDLWADRAFNPRPGER